jgi:predicted component of viral defense system (DUF524 family)
MWKQWEARVKFADEYNLFISKTSCKDVALPSCLPSSSTTSFYSSSLHNIENEDNNLKNISENLFFPLFSSVKMKRNGMENVNSLKQWGEVVAEINNLFNSSYTAADLISLYETFVYFLI